MNVKKLGGNCPTAIKKYVEKVAEKEGYVNYDINVREICTNGASFLALLYEVDIRGKTNEGDKETNIFIKNIINSEKLNSFFPLSVAYQRESYFYNELTSIFNKLQNEACVPEEERFRVIKSYGVSDSKAIVLENMVAKGYTTCYRMDTVSLKFAELSMEQLAKFHALSFAIKKKMPDYFETTLSKTRMALQYNDAWLETAIVLGKGAISGLDDGSRQKIEKRLSEYFLGYKEYMEDREGICCLCHGDYRSSNTLIKEVNGEIQEVIPVDYQLIYYGNPVNDFMFFIYLGTDKEFRTQHYGHLKDVYHNTMGVFLKYFSIDVEEVYPREYFEKVLWDKRDGALMLALYFFPLFFVPEDRVPDVGKDDLRDTKFSLSPEIQKRFADIVDEFLE